LCTGRIKAGKTTLFNAVGWCLYGKETQLLLGTQSEQAEDPIPNEHSYENNRATVEVEIDIKTPENKHIESLSIRRSAVYVKGGAVPVSTNFSVIPYHDGAPLKISDEKKFLNHFLPEDLIQFYLFDGEYLEHTATNSNLKIKDGIRKLFNIERIETASGIIGKLVEEWYKQSSKAPKQNAKISEIDNDIAVLLETQRDIEKKITDEENTKKQLKADRAGLQDELSKTKEVADLANKVKVYEEKERDFERQIKEFNQSFHQNVMDSAYLIGAKDILSDVNKMLTKNPKIESDLLPAHVREVFLNRLLERKKCVCGAHIGLNSKEEKEIRSELKDTVVEEKMDFLTDLTYKIPEIIKLANTQKNVIIGLEGSIIKAEADLKQTRIEKEQIKQQLPKGIIDTSSYDSKLSQFIAYGEDIGDADRKLVTYKGQVQDIDTKIKEERGERQKLLDKSGESNAVNKSIEVGTALKSIFDKFNKEILNKVATELENEINGLIEDNENLSNLSVRIKTENNEIDFQFTEKGASKHHRLTGGQNQLFGIIIMAAFVHILDKVGIETLPFVFMDNPFSGIDKESLDMAGKSLGDLFRNAQVIIFTTNDRYERVYPLAGENIFTAMTFVNDGTNVTTKVQGA
jgi:DNA sulfur modification protein DndD